MQILYRYIFRRTVEASLFVITTCSVIASLINLFDILDDVVKQKITTYLLFKYLWINFAPRLMDLMNVMMVLAGLFAMGELGRRLELESMRAAGLSDGKLLRPVAVLAGLIFLGVLYLQLEAVPQLNRKGDELKEVLRYGQMLPTTSTPFYVQLENVSLRASGYASNKQEMTGIDMVLFEGQRVAEMYKAERLSQVSNEWKLSNGVYRKMDPPTGQVIKYEPFEQMAYPEKFPSPPEFLNEAIHRKDMVSWMRFGKLMGERTFLARQEIHRRIALSISTAFSLLVGAWFGIRMFRFNAARAICLAILIGFAYRLIFDGFQALGVETGATWVCHVANLFLIGAAAFSRFLTAA